MIRRATKNDIAEVARLMLALWPHHSVEEMHSEAEKSIARPDQAVFLCIEGRPCGFAICSIRRDWVEGSSTSPVGYLEGIYVADDSRRKGIARGLLSACQAWAVTARPRIRTARRSICTAVFGWHPASSALSNRRWRGKRQHPRNKSAYHRFPRHEIRKKDGFHRVRG